MLRARTVALALVNLAVVGIAQEAGHQPIRITGRTLADHKALAALEKPGRVLLEDDFESPGSLKKYFEIRGLESGRVTLTTDRKLAHRGRGAIRCVAPANDGQASGSGASGWLGPQGHERIHFRRYIRFPADYDQGNLHHVGGGITGVGGTGKWDEMGKAGIRPRGDDNFKSSFEPWRDWGRYDPPGFMFLYTYWMDMKRDRDGNYWGNNLEPERKDRFVPPRDRWVCLEHMIKVNRVGEADGELAAWIDGKLYLHFTGFRWRSAEKVRIKRFNFGIYVHRATRENVVWYDDVAVSTGYIGPVTRRR
jgi:hypothetical protein